jgi:hypothetical protein
MPQSKRKRANKLNAVRGGRPLSNVGELLNGTGYVVTSLHGLTDEAKDTLSSKDFMRKTFQWVEQYGHTHMRMQTVTHTQTLSLSLYLYLSHTHTHTHTHTHAHTHTQHR